MDNSHPGNFGGTADTGHSAGRPATWNEGDANNGLFPGTSMGDGAAFSPVAGAGEQNFATPGRESWGMSDVARGDNGIPRAGAPTMDVPGAPDAGRTDWNGKDPSVTFKMNSFDDFNSRP